MFLLCICSAFSSLLQRHAAFNVLLLRVNRGGKGGGAKKTHFYFLPSVLTSEEHIPCFPPLCATTSCSIHSLWQLRYTAAGLRLRLLVLCRLFQFEEGRVAAGRRVVDRTPIGGHQGHSGVLWVGFGIRDGVRRAVAKVTIKQGVIQQLGCGPLFFQLRQSLGALFRPGLLLGGRAASVGRWHGAVGRRRCRRGRLRGDEAILCAGAIFEDGLQPGLLWLLDWRDRFDLQDSNEWFWIADVLKFIFFINSAA